MITDFSPIDPAVLDRYLAGTASPAEQSAVSHALAADPRLAALVAELRSVPLDRQAETAVAQGVDVDRAWAAMARRTGVASVTRAAPRSIARPSHFAPSSWRRMLSVGTVAAALLVAAFVAGGRLLHSGAADTAAMQYRTANGQRATVTLTDGTIVTLNVASRLDVPASFGRGERVVTLDGEAMFTVTHAARAPFVVVSGGTRTTVLGTEFAVRRYASDSAVRVSVRSGRVRVAAVGDGVVLSAGRDVAMRADGRAQVSDAHDGAFSFARGVLTFANVTVADAVPDLNRWYDADVRLATPAVGRNTLVGALPGGSRADLARTLEMILDVRAVVEGRTVTLYAR